MCIRDRVLSVIGLIREGLCRPVLSFAHRKRREKKMEVADLLNPTSLPIELGEGLGGGFVKAVSGAVKKTAKSTVKTVKKTAKKVKKVAKKTVKAVKKTAKKAVKVVKDAASKALSSLSGLYSSAKFWIDLLKRLKDKCLSSPNMIQCLFTVLGQFMTENVLDSYWGAKCDSDARIGKQHYKKVCLSQVKNSHAPKSWDNKAWGKLKALNALMKTCGPFGGAVFNPNIYICLLYTSDAADDLLCVDLGGRRIIKKKKIYT
eukprot:TRINITY_DN1792_c0_g1_i1.p1 TRINITY_DN1792_c0_g1~~TRINITY_DN1792_c0_g1_i1.p1  ORF type:complete len:260 (+),score=108.28 TRINITY_DN1792_c0_g1_i1:148-927(+)